MNETSIADKTLTEQPIGLLDFFKNALGDFFSHLPDVIQNVALPLLKWVILIALGLFILSRVVKAITHVGTHGTQHFRGFVLALTATFAAPLFLLIIIPALKHQHIHAIAYDKERDGVEGFYPPADAKAGLGQTVYAREGCVQCHTQMIRPAQIALDAWRHGAGENQDARAPGPVRSNTLRDYLGEPYAFLGVQRNGPDLTNAGYRFTDKRSDLHLHIYAPKVLNDWSNAPAYKHLYEVRQIQGAGSAKALKLPGKFAPKAGFEVVPTAEAEQLADYILSLKKDFLIPGTAVASTDKAKK